MIQSSIDKNRSDLFWAWTSSGTIVVGIAGVVFSLFQFLRSQLDKRVEREKKDEEEFHTLIRDLGSDQVVVKIDATITLRKFLRPGYEQFYRQIFDWMVINLRLSPNTIIGDMQLNEQLDVFREELITTFKTSYPRARTSLKPRRATTEHTPNSLDASRVQLYRANLARSDLRGISMPIASLRKANLAAANLKGSYLSSSDFHEANLSYINLSEATLFEANLSGANLRNAMLNKADFTRADFTRANLSQTNLSSTILFEANLQRVNLHDAYLKGADFSRTVLTEADLSRAVLTQTNLNGPDLSNADLSNADLTEANLEDVNMKDTNLRSVKGLTREQLINCKAKGAIIDEDTTIESSQPAAAPARSNDVQAPSIISIQASTPPANTDDSTSTPAQPNTEP